MTEAVSAGTARAFIAGEEIPGILVDGEQPGSAQRSPLEVIDPAWGEAVATLPMGTADDVDAAVRSAGSAFDSGEWSERSPRERGRVLQRVAAMLRDRWELLATLECIDIGKPISVARKDVDVLAGYFEYYGGVADKLAGTSQHLTTDGLGMALREPIGVSAQIIPFNFPMQTIGRGVAPALAAGCTTVIKPSPDGSLSSSKVVQLIQEAGVPNGAVNVVTGGADVGAALASHNGIQGITFTGSVPGGIAVAQTAAGNVVHSLLELGGKSASVVFDDADLTAAVAGVGRMAFYNSGQNCGAGSRLLLQRETAKPFLAALTGWTQELTIGPGLEDPYLGPLVSARQRDRVQDYLDVAAAEGATFVTGGGAPTEPRLADGFFVTPTIITDLKPDSRLMTEEIFGPVLCVATFDTLDEAVRLTNDSDFGLAAYVWTRDLETAMRFTRSARVGHVSVNTIGVGSGIELPSGGVKKSGWGREKGLTAMENYTEVKSVVVQY